MKKMTLMVATLMLAGATASFAQEHKCCKKGGKCCKKETTAKKSDKTTETTKK